MAILIVSAAGAWMGASLGLGIAALGMSGASVGWTIGSLVGQALIGGPKTEGPRLGDLRVTGTEYGQVIPWVASRPRVSGQIIWASEKRETAYTTEVGKGGGAEYTTYTYDADVLYMLAENELTGVSRIWKNNELVWTGDTLKEGTWYNITELNGNTLQMPHPVYEAAVGVGNAPAYRGRTCIMIEGLQLGPNGEIPNLTFEIGVSGTPGENRVCIAVIDENDAQPESVLGPRWASFRQAWPKRKFWLLKPNAGEALTTPKAFDTDSRAYGPIPVTRDMGIAGSASDWYSICKCNTIASNDAVALFIDNSGSMTTDTVRASYNLFLSKLAARNISVIVVTNAVEDYITPFNAILDVPGTPAVQGFYEDIKFTLDNVLKRAEYSSDEYSIQNSSDYTVKGLAISQVSSTRSVLEQLQAGYLFDVHSSDKIYFKNKNFTSVVTIPWSDIGVGDNNSVDEPFQIRLANDLEIPGQISLAFNNINADHQTATEYSDRLLSDQKSITNASLPLALTPSEAKRIVNAMLIDQINSVAGTTITLPLKYSYLEPNDIFTVQSQDSSRAYKLKVVSKKDSLGIIELECVLYENSVIEYTGVTDNEIQNVTEVIQIAPTIWKPMDIPILRDIDDEYGYYVALKGDIQGSSYAWPGGVLLRSWDNINFNQIGLVLTPAIIGTCQTTLGNFTEGNVFDEYNTLTVDVGTGTLSSVTREALFNDESLNNMLVGSEIIRFRSAELISLGVYRLSGLLRGMRGTESAISTHAANEDCIVLSTNGLMRTVGTLSQINNTSYLKAVTNGLRLATITSEPFVDTGVAVKPFSPTNLRVNKNLQDSSLNISWIRRTRKEVTYFGNTGGNVPLGESSEKYRLRIYNETVDPYVSSVKLLLHANGVNGSTTFTDSSSSPKTLVARGNAQISSTRSKFGTSSIFLDGSGDYIDCSSSELNLSNTDFTVEAWIYCTSLAVTGIVYSSFLDQTFGRHYIYINTAGDIGFGEQDPYGGNTVSAGSSAGAVTLNTWHHVAATKSGTTIRMFLNGNLVGSNTSPVRSSYANYIRIGRLDAGSFEFPFAGYIDEFRVTKGIARYTQNFSVPTEPFYDGTPSNVLTRTVDINSPNFIYTSAMQTADGFISGQKFKVEVCQLSDKIGEGFKSTAQGII